jgi:bacteriorhodopsin
MSICIDFHFRYYTVCAIMTLSTFAFLGLGYTKPRTHRAFHYITAGVTMVAAIAYFTMGSNLGWVAYVFM